MDETTYQRWWQLHLRVAKGEKLATAEQKEYNMPVLVKAIYKGGMFEPVEPIEDLVESQQVHLQVWPAVPGEVAPEVEEGAEFWSDPGWEAEWAALSPWEQQGVHVPVLTPEEIEARVQWLNVNWGCIALDSPQALEIATADWLLEENLSL